MSRATGKKYEQFAWKVFLWLECTGRLVPRSFWTSDEVLCDFIWQACTLPHLRLWVTCQRPGSVSQPGARTSCREEFRHCCQKLSKALRESQRRSVLPGFHCMLRGAQVRNLTVGDVSIGNGRAILHLRLTKGVNERAPLSL